MRKPLTQLPLDFGGEEKDPSPAGDANGNTSQRDGQYLASAGVGVRVKAYKKPATPGGNGDLFQSAPVSEGPDDLIAPAGPVTDPAPIAAMVESAPIAATAEPAPIPEVLPGPVMAVRPIKNTAPARKAAVKTGPSKRGRKSLKQANAEADLIEIPADEILFRKQYYTMGEVSEMFKVNQSLLRYWETEFDILQPRKNKKGDRYFRPVDIKNLHLIYHLLRQKKYTIEGAKDFLRNNKKAKERFEIIERLQQIRNFLLEWKAQL